MARMAVRGPAGALAAATLCLGARGGEAAPEAAKDAVATASARIEGLDLAIVKGEVRIRVSDTGARSFPLETVTSLRTTDRRTLVTTDGETLVVTSARLEDGRFVFASPRFGEFALERAKVKLLLFDGAEKLYAKLLGGFVPTGGDLVEPHPLRGSAAVAYVLTTGAQTAETFSASVDAEAVRSNWRHTLWARSNFTRSEGVRSADAQEAGYKADRFLSERAFVYARAAAAADAVAGIDLRLGLGAGAGRRFLCGPRHDLAGEVGYEFQHEDATTEVRDVSFGRVAATYALKLDGAKALSEKAEVLLGEGRTRTRSETALTAKVNGRLSVRLGFIVEHDTEPPPGAPETTTRTEAAVVWTF